LTKRFLKRLHEAGGQMSHSEIMRALHLSRNEMREIVETLLDSKQLERFTHDEKVYYREL
jgi:DNA-binding Lrp family transcriptional regulator